MADKPSGCGGRNRGQAWGECKVVKKDEVVVLRESIKGEEKLKGVKVCASVG